MLNFVGAGCIVEELWICMWVAAGSNPDHTDVGGININSVTFSQHCKVNLKKGSIYNEVTCCVLEALCSCRYTVDSLL